MGVGQEVGVQVPKNVFVRNCIKWPDLHRKMFAMSTILGYVGWGSTSQKSFFSLLQNEWNVQICSYVLFVNPTSLWQFWKVDFHLPPNPFGCGFANMTFLCKSPHFIWFLGNTSFWKLTAHPMGWRSPNMILLWRSGHFI